MKKILLLIIILSSQLTRGQVDILLDYDPGTNYNGQVIVNSSTTSSFAIYMHLVNTSNSDIDILFRRVILDSSGVFYDQFCDNNLCFPCSGLDWTAPSSITVSPGDSSIMKPQGSFMSEGFAKIRYYVIDNTTSTTLDSVDVHVIYSLIAGKTNETKNDILLYPNPSNESLSINVSNEYSGNKTITLTNINGEIVYSESAKNGVNNIDILDFKSGIYFCRFSVNNKSVFNKKLVVRR